TLAAIRRAPDLLDVPSLLGLPTARRARVLRRWIAGLGLPPLPAQGVARIEYDLLVARGDSAARFDWHGARIQRWRDVLHAGPLRDPLPPEWRVAWDGRTPLALPTGDTLALLGASGFDAAIVVHARRGGERLRLPGRTHAHALKHLLQDAGIPPWQRARMPLLSAADGTLLAAGDRLHADTFAAWLEASGARLQWTGVA
ncbi:MAG: tRNA lysidine(34) synthetase TilS, partial [Xanthomonadales bacterium]|nr:tRNA lysidine(34) synthetase TilS [Xanthomonadales bacterium]